MKFSIHSKTNLVDKLGGNIYKPKKNGLKNKGNNPYAIKDDNNQFYLPRGISDTATDDHGQILGQNLDDLFNYVMVGDEKGIETADDGADGRSLKLSDDLKKSIIDAFVFNSIGEQIELYQKCADDTSGELVLYKDDDGKVISNPKTYYPLGLCKGGKLYLVTYCVLHICT